MTTKQKQHSNLWQPKNDNEDYFEDNLNLLELPDNVREEFDKIFKTSPNDSY